MSLETGIISVAKPHGADIAGMNSASVYTGYMEEVRKRLQETGAAGKDFMAPGDAMTFFENPSGRAANASPDAAMERVAPGALDARNALPAPDTVRAMPGKVATDGHTMTFEMPPLSAGVVSMHGE